MQKLDTATFSMPCINKHILHNNHALLPLLLHLSVLQTHSMFICTAEVKLCQSSSLYALTARLVQVQQVTHHTDAQMPTQLQ